MSPYRTPAPPPPPPKPTLREQYARMCCLAFGCLWTPLYVRELLRGESTLAFDRLRNATPIPLNRCYPDPRFRDLPHRCSRCGKIDARAANDEQIERGLASLRAARARSG